MGITVKELQNMRFRYRLLENKIKIIKEGKPRPVLNMSAVTMSENGELKTEAFNPAMYDEVSWLTGCETEQCFFCWPCLLFVNSDLWKVTDLAFLSDGISEHEKDVKHIRASSRLVSFLSEQGNAVKVNLDYVEHNTMFLKNRDTMKLVISAVCSIVAGSPPFSERNSCEIKPEMCLKALNLLKLSNHRLFDNFKDAVELIKKSPKLLDDLVDAMTIVVKLAVMKEARMSTYAALIISDHSTSSANSHFSVILRYVKKGKVFEKFLGFINMLASKTSSDVIYDIIRSTIDALGNTVQFLAYSFDGGLMETEQLICLNNLLQNKYPCSYFVPCYFHDIQNILQQSLSMNTELTYFFKILTVMETYFQEGSAQREVLELFIFTKTPRENSAWYSKAPFIKIVRMCRKHFIEALEWILKDCSKWNADDNIKARGFLEFLGEFRTVFLLHILSPLYEHFVPLDAVLKNSSPEMEFRPHLVRDVTRDILEEIKNFDKYFNCAVQEMDGASLNVDYKTQATLYNFLFRSIIRLLEKEITVRFSKLEDLVFCSLVNVHLVEIRKKKLDYYYWKLNSTSGNQFSAQLFDSEVKVQQANRIFLYKNANDLLDCFEDSNLKSVFKCTSRLLEFTLTMPFRPPAQSGYTSKFQELKRYSYPRARMTKTKGDACVLFVESDILRELLSGVFFYDEIMEKLAEVNKNLSEFLAGRESK